MTGLKHRWEAVRTVPGLGKDVAATLVLVALAVVSVVWIQGNLYPGGLFAKETLVRVEFSAIPGANPNAPGPVTIAGVQVGKVRESEATNRGTALVTLAITGEQPVFSNARAVLRPKNPLNEMSVELNPGGPPGTPLTEGQIVPVSQTAAPVQADQVLQQLDSRAQAALTDLLVESDVALVRAPAELPGALRATTDTTVALRPVVDALAQRREQIAELVSALSRIAGAVGDNTERTARLADATQAALGTLASNDDSLRASLAQLPGLSDELRRALTSTQDLTKQLNPTLDGLDRAAAELPPALDALRDTTGPLGDTVDAARPFVDRARPVVADLRQFVDDADGALTDLRPVTRRLDRNTEIVTRYVDDLRGFLYNTSSLFGTGDANGGIVRGHAVVAPGGGLLPLHSGYAPGKENGLDPAKRNVGILPLGGTR